MRVTVNSQGGIASDETLRAIEDVAFHVFMALRFPEIRPWEPIWRAPRDRPIEAWVKRYDGVQYRLPFPIQLSEIVLGTADTGIWVNAWTDQILAVHPSHWREWHGRAR